MAGLDLAERYFAAWNAHDPGGIIATFVDGGTYDDPTTGPLTGEAIGGYAAGLFSAFPDLSFDETDATVGQDGAAAVQWVMHGTNTGSFGGAPPSGSLIAVPGADFFTFDDNGIRSVKGYFDQRTLLEQLGLRVIAQPVVAGPFHMGMSVRVSTGRTASPGAVSLTWIDARSDAEAERVRDHSQRIAASLLNVPGFLTWTGLVIGQRMHTVTTWEDVESARRIGRDTPHRTAMREFFNAELGSAVHTSVWSLDHANPVWVRCASCQKVMNYDQQQGICECGAQLPEKPPYW